jgi:TonB-linked SusC/RagA family outer membrane protein
MPLTAILFIFSFHANAAADSRPEPASPAYNIIVNGKVTDEKGQALEGATVSVKGAVAGTKSDANGNFSIEAGEDATLVITYIGYNTAEIKVNGQSSVSVQLEPSASIGQQVVVIGYGTQSKKTLTGAISVIDNDVLKSRPAMETTNLLQGVSAGLQITRTNTGNIRGSVNNITIRGVTSRSAPGVLVVVDGIPQAANDATALDNINPEDIDNISILKDGQAAIYGARAAGGVILITTKVGKSGAPALHFSSGLTIQKPALMRKPTNILQLYEMQNEGYVNDGQTTNAFSNVVKFVQDNNITFDKIKGNNQQYLMREPYGNDHPYYLGHYDWNDIMFDPALQQNYNVAVSGKRNNLSYYESISYADQDGMLAYGSNYKRRLLVTLKNDYDVSPILKIISNINIGTQKVTEPYNYTGYGYNGLQGALFFSQTVLEPYTKGGHFMDIGGFYDPVAYAVAGGNTTDLSYILHGTLGFDLKPVENLLISGEFSSNYNITENDWANLDFPMYDPLDNFVQTAYGGLNQAGSGYSRDRYTIGNINATYTYDKLKNQKIKVLAGYSQEGDNYRSMTAYRRYGLISPGLPTMSAGAANEQYNGETKNAYSLNSAYSRLEYSFKNRYLFEGVFRYDGSSKFAEGYKWSPFFGLSAGWIISEEDFMKSLLSVVDFLKIRGSWGQLGNQTGIGLYDYLYQINVGGGYPMGSPTAHVQAQAATLGTLPSTTRTWEKIESKNIGIDFTSLNSRVTGSFDYYIKDNKNMFFNQEFPQVLGATPPNINGAYLRTKGWELEVGWRDRIRDFSYFVKFNLTDNRTRVIKLADAAIPAQGTNAFVEGYPYQSYFGLRYDGLIQSAADLSAYNASMSSGIPGNLKVGDARYKDVNGDGKLTALPYQVDKDGKPTATSGDLVQIGEGGQHYLFGVSLGFSWKSFDFSSFFQGVMKWQVISDIRVDNQWYEPNEAYQYHQTWAPDRLGAVWPRLSQDGTIKNYNYQYSDAPYKLYNNRYFRLKNLQVGYTLPKSVCNKLKVNNLRVYFSGTDLWEMTNLPGNQDPETPFSHLLSPFPRQYAFGLTLTL